MGAPKQLLPYNGTTLLKHAVNTALKTSCRPIVIVIGANSQQIAQECAELPVVVVVNEDWKSGLASSIASGVRCVLSADAGVEAVVIELCDQPRVTEDLLMELADKYSSDNAPLVACEYGGTVGVPALFSLPFFGNLLSLSGEQGAKGILLGNLDIVRRVPFEEASVDIDTPADYNVLNSL
jgi:molybdenum cofactor cytidylyltransferase